MQDRFIPPRWWKHIKFAAARGYLKRATPFLPKLEDEVWVMNHGKESDAIEQLTQDLADALQQDD